MSSFTDTSNWKSVNDYMLSYDGQDKELLCEKKPATFYIKVSNLVFTNTISLNHDYGEEGDEALYSRFSRVSGSGKLESCNFHVISLDENDNEVFSDVTVHISPIAEIRLKKTSRKSTLSMIGEERPPDGWLHDEPGRIYFHGEGDFNESSSLSVSLNISDAEYLELAENIRKGLAASFTIEVCADVYQFDYETMGAGMRWHRYNYAMLREVSKTGPFGDNYGDGGQTVARLEELTVGFYGDQNSNTEIKKQVTNENEYERHAVDAYSGSSAAIVEDVKRIRERIDLLYSAAVFLVVIVIISQVLKWF